MGYSHGLFWVVAKLSPEVLCTKGFMHDRFYVQKVRGKSFHGMRPEVLSPLSATYSRRSSTRREGQSARLLKVTAI
jgi:hypothetical protein